MSEPRWEAATGHQGTQQGAQWRAGKEKGSPGAEKGEVTGGKFWAGDSSCHWSNFTALPQKGLSQLGVQALSIVVGKSLFAVQDPCHGGVSPQLGAPCPAPLVLVVPLSLSMAVAPVLLWVTALHCTLWLLSARVELPRTGTSPGLMQMLNFLQLPSKHHQENVLQEAASVGTTPTKALPLSGGDLGAEKGEGVGGDSKGGSSGLSRAP